MIRVLIADDSKVVALLLQSIISSEPDMEVIGVAVDGEEAVKKAKRLKPDIITMDINMPKKDGFQATQEIMADNPTPIVVVSSTVNDAELKTTFKAMNIGALAVLEKPSSLSGDDFETIRSSLLQTLRTMSEIKVVRRSKKLLDPMAQHKVMKAVDLPEAPLAEVIVLGGSTGATDVYQAILSNLPAGFPVPIVLVQHMSSGFLSGFAHWLAETSSLIIKLATDGEKLRRGVVYVAPDDHQATLRRSGHSLLISLQPRQELDTFCPAVDPLFVSAAKCCPGHAIGGLLTGMGNDGAAGLSLMKAAGCLTFAQDKESCVVFGMPGSAVALNATEVLLPKDRIADYINENLNLVTDSRKRDR